MHIAVIGGGPAGAVAALTLVGRGHKVTVVEAASEPRRKTGECLSPGVDAMLEMLGLLDGMEGSGHLRSPGNQSFWGSTTATEHDFLFGRQGEGWHLDRKRFEADLVRTAVDAGVSWLGGRRLRLAERVGDTWQLVLDGTACAANITVDHVIDASGRTRAFARTASTVCPALLAGGEPDRLLGLTGLFSPCSTTGLRDRRAVVEATELGWWYSALLADGSLVAVAMTDADLLPTTDPWETLLEPAPQTRDRLASHGGRSSGPPRARVAHGSRLECAQGEGWTAVGDAALAFDPLSSYGIASAMGTGYYGAHAVADTLSGRNGALLAYQAIVDQTWQRYLDEHRDQYALECRWRDQPFWQRRLTGNVAPDTLSLGSHR